MGSRINRTDIFALAGLALLLLFVLRTVRSFFVADPADGETVADNVTKNFGLAAALYLLVRLALRLPGPWGIAAAGAAIATGVAGPWVGKALGAGGGSADPCAGHGGTQRVIEVSAGGGTLRRAVCGDGTVVPVP